VFFLRDGTEQLHYYGPALDDDSPLVGVIAAHADQLFEMFPAALNRSRWAMSDSDSAAAERLPNLPPPHLPLLARQPATANRRE
jgi:hypothetical protein